MSCVCISKTRVNFKLSPKHIFVSLRVRIVKRKKKFSLITYAKIKDFHHNQFFLEFKEHLVATQCLKNLFFFFSHSFIAKIFLMNWTWIFHFTKTRIPITQTEYTLTHQKELWKIPWEDDGHGVPNKHFPTQTVLNIIHTSEPVGKNAKIALQAQKRS